MMPAAQWQCLRRYLLAGGAIFAVGYGQYQLLYAVLSGVQLRAGMAWAFHFILGTLWTHALHRGYTFRHVPQLTYWASLARTYGAYLSLGALSTLMMLAICDVNGFDPVAGWVLTTLTTAIGNFLVMSRWSICSPLKGPVNALDRAHSDRPHEKRSP
jgi:putative flippase GtrA